MPHQRKKGPPAHLRISTPHTNPNVALVQGPSSAADDGNTKNLPLDPHSRRIRSSSVISLPATSLLHRREEEHGSPTVPYLDGPIQIIPGIWLGSEDNARDWKGLLERGIRAILNVAKEVSSPFDSLAAARPLRPSASTPNLNAQHRDNTSTYYPPHIPSGRPGMHYLKLQWSHGQQNLVDDGFPTAMAFTDAALRRGDGVLIHCQCGISRSATLVIALVMRAAAESSDSVPPEIWALKGMHSAYSYVKDKSKWVSPNMSLIYQLLEYERKLRGDQISPSSSERNSAIADEEEEWGRKRRLLDDVDHQSKLVIAEAQALDKAMEDRIVARKSSTSSIASSGVGMGPAWRSRYATRKRTGSVASSNTNGSSILSEDLVEEDEEQELLGVGGGFDDERPASTESISSTSESTSPDDETDTQDILFTPATARPIEPPPTAPVWKSSFTLSTPMPATAIRPTFDLPPSISTPKVSKARHRPPPLGFLPPVPSSPITIVSDDPPPVDPPKSATPIAPIPTRLRTESRRPAPPPLHLRHTSNAPPIPKRPSLLSQSTTHTPSHTQTLFVFPPSPTTHTSTLTSTSTSSSSSSLASTASASRRSTSTTTLMLTTVTPAPTPGAGSSVPFPSANPGLGIRNVSGGRTMSMTPRVATFRGAGGRPRSFIDVGLGAPQTPTMACSRVDVRGWVGLGD